MIIPPTIAKLYSTTRSQTKNNSKTISECKTVFNRKITRKEGQVKYESESMKSTFFGEDQKIMWQQSASFFRGSEWKKFCFFSKKLDLHCFIFKLGHAHLFQENKKGFVQNKKVLFVVFFSKNKQKRKEKIWRG